MADKAEAAYHGMTEIEEVRLRTMRLAVEGMPRDLYDTDPMFHASVKQLASMTEKTMDAMRAEGIDRATRKRVIFRVLYGDPVSPEEGLRAQQYIREMVSRTGRLSISHPPLDTRPR